MYIPAFTHQFDLPAPEDTTKGWVPNFLFCGSTKTHAHISVHYSVLSAGHCPHPPHIHADEELLVILDGEADIVIARSPGDLHPVIHHLAVGQFAYYPAWQHHTLRSSSSRPVTYLMFKWRNRSQLGRFGELRGRIAQYLRHRRSQMPAGITDFRPFMDTITTGFFPQVIFAKPTGYLAVLHCHITRLAPGAGYAAHADAHDVAIVLLNGRVKTNGATLTNVALAYYSAGELHDMNNSGNDTATYLVLEFHHV